MPSTLCDLRKAPLHMPPLPTTTTMDFWISIFVFTATTLAWTSITIPLRTLMRAMDLRTFYSTTKATEPFAIAHRSPGFMWTMIVIASLVPGETATQMDVRISTWPTTSGGAIWIGITATERSQLARPTQ